MKILVTGANGQLGRCLRALIGSSVEANIPEGTNNKADVPSGMSPSPEGALPPSAVFTDIDELDITDLSAVRAMVAREGIDTIVNCAGYTNVEKAEEEPELAERINALAVENLARAMKEVGGLLVHISTDYVFGGEVFDTPIREDQRPAPTGVYGLTKLHGEEAILRVGCRHIIIRTAWLYSPYGHNFVKTMLRLTAEKPSLKVVNDQMGTPTYAMDLARVIVRFLSEVGLSAPSRASALLFASEGVEPDSEGVTTSSDSEKVSSANIYNYTNEGACSWYEFAKAIAAEAGHTSCDIQPCRSDQYPSRVRRPAYSVLDKSKIKARLGGLMIPHWTVSLKECLRVLRSQDTPNS